MSLKMQMLLLLRLPPSRVVAEGGQDRSIALSKFAEVAVIYRLTIAFLIILVSSLYLRQLEQLRISVAARLGWRFFRNLL